MPYTRQMAIRASVGRVGRWVGRQADRWVGRWPRRWGIAGWVARLSRQGDSPTAHPGTNTHTQTENSRTKTPQPNAPRSKIRRLAPPRSDKYIDVYIYIL